VFVLDIDLDEEKQIDGYATLAALEAIYGPLPHTPHQRTGRGGTQYFFKYVDGLKNSTGKLGEGIDTRGEGGYVVVAPSRNTNGDYKWIVSPDDAPLADVPKWIIDRLAKVARPAPGSAAPAARNLDPYIDRAFRDEIANVATAANGTKHDTLRDAAIRLGTLIPHGLDEHLIEDGLYNAISGRADDPTNALKTIQDGIAYGAARPRTISNRARPIERAASHDSPLRSHSLILGCLGMGEAGDAQLVATLYAGQLVYDHAAGSWYTFEGHAWVRYDGMPRQKIWGEIAAVYLDTAAQIQAQAGTDKESIAKTVDALTERAKKLRSVSRVNNVLTFAQELLGIKGNEWDADPWLLGVANGVIDLRTGQLRNGAPADYIRTIAPTAWAGLDAPAPRWERFVSEVLSNEADRVAFLQRLLGYALNGSTKEHVLSFFVGERGRNGKRVLFEALQGVLGDYAQSVSTDVLIGQQSRRNAGSAQPHLMKLQGKRITYCSETGEHDALSAAQVKNITGGDPITARRLNENLVTFIPTHTLFLQTNKKPQAPADDDALWERVKVIEFKVRFVEHPLAADERPRDSTLEGTLQAEASGILAWLVRGGLDWQQLGGLKTPASVRLARDTYRKGESIEPFLNDCCTEWDGGSTEGGALNEAYKTWCELRGLHPKSAVWLSKQLVQRFEKGRVTSAGPNTGRTVYHGVTLRDYKDWTHEESPYSSTTFQSATNPSIDIETPNSNNSNSGIEGLRPHCNPNKENIAPRVDQLHNPSIPSIPSIEGLEQQLPPGYLVGQSGGRWHLHTPTGAVSWHRTREDAVGSLTQHIDE